MKKVLIILGLMFAMTSCAVTEEKKEVCDSTKVETTVSSLDTMCHDTVAVKVEETKPIILK